MNRAAWKVLQRQLSGARRISVRAARSQAELAAMCEVRRLVYCVEKGFLDDGRLLDPYDARATVLNAWDGERAVGTLRVMDSAQGSLEIFDMHPELLELVPDRTQHLLECSRLMVLRSHRNLSVTLALFRSAFREMMRRSARGMIASCARHLIPYYERIGFRLLSERPLNHLHLRGLKDYPMLLEWPRTLAFTTLDKLPFWFAISPMSACAALIATTARRLTAPPTRLLISTTQEEQRP